jgi:hypothetical protein
MSEMDAKKMELVVAGFEEAVYGTTYHGNFKS